ncbi:MAG: CotH kinase family protein [Paludibacteraceae bacterium]
MKKRLLFLSLCLPFFSLLHSQKLTGTIIGDFNAFDYSPYACSSTVNTPTNVFDGNLQNTYAACDRNNGWIGLDLGEPHVITEVAFCPRPGHPSRVELGIFEGANNPDFGDALPLYVITDVPTENVLTKKPVSNSRAFRYVRYKGPVDTRCNIAEVEFYGTKSVGDDSKLYQLTNLPTVIIHTRNEEDITSKEVYLKGIFTVVSENGTEIFSDSTEIRGRGNASWSFPKKPYRIKLFNKTSLLGMPAKEKSWTLINNYGDKTLMRNLLAFDLSNKLGLEYTPAGKAVDVILNGQYKGTYQLCDQIEVAKQRVDIEKMAETTVSLPDLSGGYFLEIDAYAYSEISWFESARNRIPVTIKYPKDDDINSIQRNYIIQFFNNMENTLYTANYRDPVSGYRKYIDMESFLRLFLVGEISGNTDTFWSTYMYKHRDNNTFFFGPVWDFDIAYENDNRTYPINSLSDWIYRTKGSAATGARDFVNRIFSDPQTTQDLKRIYSHYRDNKIITQQTLNNVADSLSAELNESQKLNFKRWNILNTYVHQNPQIYGSYYGEVESVKSYIRERIEWIDNKIGYTPSAVNTPSSPPIICRSKNQEIILSEILPNAKITIYNVAGNRVYRQISTTNQLIIPIEKGIYIVNVVEESSLNSSFKVIVN